MKIHPQILERNRWHLRLRQSYVRRRSGFSFSPGLFWSVIGKIGSLHSQGVLSSTKAHLEQEAVTRGSGGDCNYSKWMRVPPWHRAGLPCNQSKYMLSPQGGDPWPPFLVTIWTSFKLLIYIYCIYIYIYIYIYICFHLVLKRVDTSMVGKWHIKG